MHRHNIFCLVKVMWSTQRLLCVDIGFSVSACFMGSFSVEKVPIRQECVIYVPDHVVTLAQDGTSPNMGWPNKELTTLSLLRPKIP